MRNFDKKETFFYVNFQPPPISLWHLRPRKLECIQYLAYVFQPCHWNLILLPENWLDRLDLALIKNFYVILRKRYVRNPIFCDSHMYLESTLQNEEF